MLLVTRLLVVTGPVSSYHDAVTAPASSTLALLGDYIAHLPRHCWAAVSITRITDRTSDQFPLLDEVRGKRPYWKIPSP